MNLDDRDLPYIAPVTIDEARLQLVADLHRAVYGVVWARPESPAEVWRDLLTHVAAERALADDLAADLAKYVNRSEALARYRKARQR